MSVVIELSDELEAELNTEASDAGMSLTDYVVRLVRQGRAPQSSPQNGSELLAFWRSEGLVGSRPEIVDSASHARRIRHQAETR